MFPRLLSLTPVVCLSLFAADTGKPKKEVTFHKDVQAILQSHCQECHRPGEVAPMPLLTYQQARPWAKSIKQAVLTEKMPPWPADPHFGKFSNDRSLTKEQIQTLAAWADGGAKEGDRKDSPAPRKWIEGWNIDKPDVVLSMPQAFPLPAKAEIEYQYIVVPTGFTEDKWVQEVEVRPSNRGVVHHAVMWIREPGDRWLKDAKPGVPFVPAVKSEGQRFANTTGGMNETLTIYTPGMVPDIWKPGQGKLIKAGSDIIFQMHYTTNGTAGEDKTKIGIVFAKQTPTEKILTVAALNNRLEIPPGDPNYVATGMTPIINPVKIISFFPHMHFRGKQFEYEIVYPDGHKETPLKLKSWDLGWQLSYKLAEPISLPAGAKVFAKATFDNSKNNPANPDPTATVHWGEQSWEEMLVGFFDVIVDPRVTSKNFYQRQPPRAE
ncbi:MAG: cytochrome c [Bryobacteraceae bacterium]